MNTIYSFWAKTLNNKGYRLTKPRAAVIQSLAETERALNPTQIFFIAHQNCNSLGLVTVYRTLEKLEELHLIQKVYCEDGSSEYFPRSEGHNHLLICKHCHRTESFSGDDLHALFATLNVETGFEVKDHWLQLEGVCANCQHLSREKLS